MSDKITVGFTSLSSCSGCQISFLDIHEKMLNLLNSIQLIYAPIIMDYRSVPDNIDLMLVEGSVGNEDDLKHIQEVRKKAKYVVAVGSCASFGGIPGLRNFFDRDDILSQLYKTDNSENGSPDLVKKGNGMFHGPNDLLNKVKPVNAVIDVDFNIPGCPPLPENFIEVIKNFPNFDKIKLPSKTLCSECTHRKEKLLSAKREFTSLKINHPYETDLADDLCFLEKGVLCLGVATRAGCGGRCLKVNVPCRGCFGPPARKGSEDLGASFISAISSILPTGRLMAKEDMLGLVYRYSLSNITDLQKYSNTREE